MLSSKYLERVYECVTCHRAFNITHPLNLLKWRWKISYCPFCGAHLSATEEELRKSGYEPHES